MSLSPAQVLHQQKIDLAKRTLEVEGGKRIDPQHIQEWALLDIAEMLQAIHYQLVLLTTLKPLVGRS